jgi:hypothetical protein
MARPFGHPAEFTLEQPVTLDPALTGQGSAIITDSTSYDRLPLDELLLSGYSLHELLEQSAQRIERLDG